MDQPRERDENGEKWEWRPLRLGDGREIRIFLGNGNDEDAYALENCNVVGVVLTMRPGQRYGMCYCECDKC